MTKKKKRQPNGRHSFCRACLVSLVDRPHREITRAGVDGAGADKAVVAELLQDMCGPAGDPENREDRRELVLEP